MLTLLNPVTEFMRGLSSYGKGLRWLGKHPRYLIILFMPMLFAFVAVSVGTGYFLRHDEQLFSFVLFAKPEVVWMLALYYICKALLYVAFFTLAFLSFVLIANILASPIYEYVSMAIERDLSPDSAADISFWKSILLMGEELKKVVFIIFVSVVLLMIPGFNLVSTFVAAFLVGWEFYDYPLARRGWTFKQRFKFVLKDFWAVMGFGIWLVIPFLNLFLMPLAVAGGTILNIEALQRTAAAESLREKDKNRNFTV